MSVRKMSEGCEVRSPLCDANTRASEATTTTGGGKHSRNAVTSVHETTTKKNAGKTVKKVYARRREKGVNVQRTVVFEKHVSGVREPSGQHDEEEEKENEDTMMRRTKTTTTTANATSAEKEEGADKKDVEQHQKKKNSKTKARNMTRELGAFFADMRSYFARVDKFALREEDEIEKNALSADNDGDEEKEEEQSLGGCIPSATATGGKGVGGLPSVAEEGTTINATTTEGTTSPMRVRDKNAVSKLEKSIARRRSSMGMSRRLSLVLQAKDGDRDTPLRRKLSFASQSRTSLTSTMTPSRLSFGGAAASGVGARLSGVHTEHADAETVRETRLGGVHDIDKAKVKKNRASHLDVLDEVVDEIAPGATTILEEVEEVDAEGHEDDVDESCIGLSGISLLMKACEQDSIKSADALPSLHDFVSSFVAPPSPETAPVSSTQTSTDSGGATLRKIGEGTFGEAFKGADGSVFKIVPIEGTMLVNGELQKSAEDIIPEVVVARSLSSLRCRSRTSSEVTSAFVELRGSAVCRGEYPRELLDAWNAWDKEHTSENDCPQIFKSDQHYIVFVFADGGRDLERFKVNTFDEARSIIMQTAMALAVAEAACRFEHRDLHWGNLLITRAGDGLGETDENADANRSFDSRSFASTSLQCRLNGVDINMASAGVKVTLIDFTLSRIDNGSDCAFCDLSLDPELFKGPARDPQADSYRRMKKLTKNDWSTHCPKTNVVWLQYLSEVMLSMKNIGFSSAERRELKTFKKRIGGYEKAGEVVWDAFFKGAWRSVTGHADV